MTTTTFIAEVQRLMDDFGYNEVEARKIAFEKIYGD